MPPYYCSIYCQYGRLLWVPLELSAAYEAYKVIGIYVLSSPTIPEYLRVFPIMRFYADLNQFGNEYKKDTTLAKSVLESARKPETRMADDFF